MRRATVAVVLAGALLVVPAAALARGPGASGLLVRVQGDLSVDADEMADLVVVVSGDALIRGRAAALVVVGGTARISGARVGHLVVIRGTAELGRGAVVTGDVWLVSARLEQAAGAAVEGAVHRGVGRSGWGWLAISPLLSLGLLALVLATGLLAVAIGSGTLRRAGEVLTADVLGTLGSTLILFLVVPTAAVLAFFTVVGTPAALTTLVVVLPLLALAGFTVSALRLGRWMLRSTALRPYGAVVVGSMVLLAAGLVPVAGQLLVLAGGAFGAGALALAGWRARGGSPQREGG
ncbi:MAG: hypothetical protein ABIJ48_04390 [Actinomycetota bacterium]